MTRSDPSRLRLALRALANPKVIGWPMFWISYALFALDRLPVFGGVDLGEPLPVHLLATAWTVTVAQVAMFTLLLLARWTYLGTQVARRHPSWTVWTFLIAALVGDAAGQTAGRWAEPLLGSASGSAALDNALAKAIALCVIGVIVAALARHRDAVSGLTQARMRLASTQAQAQQALEQEGAQALATLRTSIDSTLAVLSESNPAASVTALRSAAEEVVRPLSHELAERGPQFSPSPPPPVRPAPWRKVLAEVPTLPLITPLLMAIVMTLLASRSSFKVGSVPPSATAQSTTLGPLTLSVDLRPLIEAVLVLVTVFTVTWLVAWAVRRLTVPLLARSRLPWQWATALGGIVLVGVISQAIIGLAFRLPGFPPLPAITPWVNLLLLTPLLIVGLVNGVVRAVALRQASLRTELLAVNEDLAWETARTNEELWHRRRELARAVHGPLQACLNAGAITIDAAMVNGTADAALMNQVREQIEGVLNGLMDATVTHPSLDQSIAQSSQLWSDVCGIDAEITPQARELLERDRLCQSTAAQVVEEACANAVIHGHAGTVQIGIDAPGERTLQIVVTDDGTPSTDGDVGLGSQFLDEVSVHWSRVPGPNGTRLCVVLPGEDAASAPHRSSGGVRSG